MAHAGAVARIEARAALTEQIGSRRAFRGPAPRAGRCSSPRPRKREGRRGPRRSTREPRTSRRFLRRARPRRGAWRAARGDHARGRRRQRPACRRCLPTRRSRSPGRRLCWGRAGPRSRRPGARRTTPGACSWPRARPACPAWRARRPRSSRPRGASRDRARAAARPRESSIRSATARGERSLLARRTSGRRQAASPPAARLLHARRLRAGRHAPRRRWATRRAPPSAQRRGRPSNTSPVFAPSPPMLPLPSRAAVSVARAPRHRASRMPLHAEGRSR